MDFFEHIDYREALKQLVSERKLLDSKFGFHSLADAARIQRPYMSKVVNSKADLSSDQLYLICEHLKLDGEKSQFLEDLLNYSRSAVSSRKKKLRDKITSIADSKRSSESNLKSKVVTASSSQDLSLYYLSPWNQLAHVALSIPRYAKDPKLLAAVLGISAREMQRVLQDLTSLNLVTLHQGEYKTLERHLHLNRMSPVFHAWKNQVRLSGLQRQQSLSENSSYSFTAIFSANEATRKKVHSRFLALLKEFEDDVREADAQQVFQMSFDLFPWV